ncbi:MAG TPA: DUF1972 domain-containing protein [Salinimicrobium sp.]|nr:DUF1972 domain-containing protein [Salinimicrobium sp.]
MRIAIIGTRGIPANYGGFETFAEEVAKRMTQKSIEVLVIGDKSLDYNKQYYIGVQIEKTKNSKPQNPIGFYRESLKKAIGWDADFILMCGVGGTMLIPFFKSKKRVIAVNPDGLGFKRDKYVWWKKAVFYSQYFAASKVSQHLVCDSIGIQTYFRKKIGRKRNSTVIEYGTYLNPFLKNKIKEDDFKKHELAYKLNEYHLVVARLEPENNVKMIMEGFLNSDAKFPLVIVGNLNTPHSKDLIKYKSDKLHFIGGVYDREKLQLLRAGSKSYWHGHSVGGTNPSLLEAMGSANLCVCHENIFNREVVLENGFYFENSKSAAKLFDEVEANNFQNLKNGALERAKIYYNWERITDMYVELAKETTRIND